MILYSSAYSKPPYIPSHICYKVVNSSKGRCWVEWQLSECSAQCLCLIARSLQLNIVACHTEHQSYFMSTPTALLMNELTYGLVLCCCFCLATSYYTLPASNKTLNVWPQFGKCKPIIKILSLKNSSGNFLCICNRDFQLISSVLLPYFVGFKNLIKTRLLIIPSMLICFSWKVNEKCHSNDLLNFEAIYDMQNGDVGNREHSECGLIPKFVQFMQEMTLPLSVGDSVIYCSPFTG